MKTPLKAKMATTTNPKTRAVPSIAGIDFSDHRNYWKFDYPAVMITDTAFYRSKNYHTPNDTPDTLNYENMAKVTDGIFELLKEL
ncbi:MAG: M28 family peptidase [Campylobacterota bacterium]|nr:M28 family peptidase [Campylobacterota bacterium]